MRLVGVQGSVSLAQLCVTEAAVAALKLLAAFAREVKHVCGLVFWLVCLYGTPQSVCSAKPAYYFHMSPAVGVEY